MDGHPQDFNYRSLHSEVYALALFGPLRTPRHIPVRLSGAVSPEVLRNIRETWAQFTDLPLEYGFLKDRLQAQYRNEQRLSDVFMAFSFLALVIACLGLLGMTMYMVQKRRKEIGVRKILGASVPGIMGLLTGGFVRLFLVSFLLASPLAYAIMHRWLQNFAYRIEINPVIFLIAGGIALLVAQVAVSYQTLRAAAANPVDSLRYE